MAPTSKEPPISPGASPPTAASPNDVVTGEFSAIDTPDLGGATCDLPAAAPTASPATCDFGAPTDEFGTLDFQAATEALPGSAPPPVHSDNETCEFGAGDVKPLATALRAAGTNTQPAAPDSTAQSNVPARAGRYAFKKFHAKGGMGEVWLAEDSDIGRPVALKRILKGRENYVLSFLKEARVTGQLEHPGVIPVHELSLDESGQPYYVMKFVQGQTLKQVIDAYHKGKRSSESSEEQWNLLRVFLSLCQTIAYAHSRGVIHRDIKPDNVMVGAYGETLVLDWGLAKVVGEPESDDPLAAIQLSGADTMASQAGSVKGTPTYFAPEVAAGKVDEVDQLSDVYLLGGTLYCLLTNKQPREGKKISELLELARTKPPIPPRQLDPTIPKPLDAICRKALAHNKVDRYASAAALAEDMQRFLAGDPVSAYQENLVERTWRWVKRHRTALGRTAGLLLIASVATTAFLFVRSAEIDRAKAQAQADQLQAEEDARQEIKTFRARAEEARFYAASANPVAEAIPGLDANQANVKADEALTIASQWGPELDKMPLEAERPGLKKDLYDLLIEMAQLKSRQDIKETQSLLARAVRFQTPTRSYYRLHALCLKAEGDQAKANADQARAKDPAIPAAAMDYYLLGEQSRVESLRDVKDDVTEGKRAGIKGLLFRNEALQEAIKYYRQSVREDPNQYWAHFQLGQCYSALKSYAEAAEAFGACIALRPRAAWGYSARGLALSTIESRSAEAQADLDTAIKLDPSFRPVRLHLAWFYAQRMKYEEADAAFAKILPPAEPNPMPETYFAHGQMLMSRTMFKEAIPNFEKAVASKRPIRAAFLSLARCYYVEGDEQKTVDNLASFLKSQLIFEKPYQLHERIARELRFIAAELKADDKNRALRERAYLIAFKELNAALKMGGDSATIYDEFGSLHELLAELQPKEAGRRLKQAIGAYTEGIKLAPGHPNLHIKRGWTYTIVNDNQKARDDFARAVELAPTNAEAHTGLGYTEALLKAPRLARIHANLALMHGANDYLNLHNVACIFGALIKSDASRAEEYEDIAIAQLERAVELWNRGGKKGPDEHRLIEGESAFPPRLRARPEFKKLLPKS